MNTTATAIATATRTLTPLEAVQGIYAAFGRGDMPGLFELLHPQIDWSATCTAPGAELVPMLRHGTGHDAVQHYFGGVAQLEFHVFQVGRCFTDGDTVVAEIHLEATHRRSGKRATIDELHHWVVREGRAVRYRSYVDTAALIELYRP